jgi:hypothetical protein
MELKITGGVVLIDNDDFPLVKDISWHISKSRGGIYARGTVDGRKVMLHRYLMGVLDAPEVLVDHRNSNTLDCQRSSNLRASTASQNGQNKRLSSRNKTGWKGVWKSRESKKFGACIMAFGRKQHLGYFNCPTAAGLAYIKAAKKLHGEFARVR